MKQKQNWKYFKGPFNYEGKLVRMRMDTLTGYTQVYTERTGHKVIIAHGPFSKVTSPIDVKTMKKLDCLAEDSHVHAEKVGERKSRTSEVRVHTTIGVDTGGDQ